MCFQICLCPSAFIFFLFYCFVLVSVILLSLPLYPTVCLSLAVLVCLSVGFTSVFVFVLHFFLPKCHLHLNFLLISLLSCSNPSPPPPSRFHLHVIVSMSQATLFPPSLPPFPPSLPPFPPPLPAFPPPLSCHTRPRWLSSAPANITHPPRLRCGGGKLASALICDATKSSSVQCWGEERGRWRGEGEASCVETINYAYPFLPPSLPSSLLPFPSSPLPRPAGGGASVSTLIMASVNSFTQLSPFLSMQRHTSSRQFAWWRSAKACLEDVLQ